MAKPTPSLVTRKFQKLHRKLGAFDRSGEFAARFVKYGLTRATDFASTHVGDEETVPTYPIIVKSTVPKELENSFAGSLGTDEKIFIVLAHSIVDKLPYETLAERAEQFISERTGQKAGAIIYGETYYTISVWFPKVTIGEVTPQYVIRAKAIKSAKRAV